MNEIFDREYARLMTLSKKAIALESVERGFTSARGVDSKVRNWSKTLLARELADRIQRLELRGY